MKSIGKQLRSFNINRIIVILILSLTVGMAYYNNAAAKYTITPVEGTAGSVELRGASIDGVWMDGALLYQKGNWEQNYYTCSSIDSSSLTVRVPYGKDVFLVFSAGPERGSAVLSSGGKEETLNFYSEDENVGQQSYPVDNYKDIWFYACLASLVAFLGLVVFQSLYSKCYKYINSGIFERVFLILIPVIAFAVLYELSLSSTPKIPDRMNMFGYDAAVYNLLGQGWNDGLLPYRDLFEAKGPLAFLFYALGQRINSSYGVFTLQVVFMSTSLIVAYKTARLFVNEFKSVIATLAALLYYTLVIDEGGIVEEINLPVLMISNYFAIEYFLRAKTQTAHPPKYALIYGVTFSVSLCLRVTDCVVICCYVAWIAILLITKKEYKNLLQNAIGFMIGVLCIVLPFIIYYWARGALKYLIDGYKYQFIYTLNSAEVSVKTAYQWGLMILYLSPVLGCAFLSIERDRYFKIPMIFSAVMTVLMFKKLLLYPHYYVVLITFVPVAVSLFLSCEKHPSFIPLRYTVLYVLVSVFLVELVLGNCFKTAKEKDDWISRLHYCDVDSEYSAACKDICELIPDESRDKVLSYDMPCDWWLISDLYPCHRLPTSGDYHFSMYQEFREEYIQCCNTTAEWIVVSGDIGCEDVAEVIYNNFSEYYSVHINDGDYWITLYHRNV